MLLCFTLSMPGVASRNGKWSGEGRVFAKVINFKARYGTSKKAIELAEGILSAGYYTYCFGDGWTAGVDVKKVDAKQAAKIRRKTEGFSGYDWMVQSIIDYGEILNTPQRERRDANNE